MSYSRCSEQRRASFPAAYLSLACPVHPQALARPLETRRATQTSASDKAKRRDNSLSDTIHPSSPSPPRFAQSRDRAYTSRPKSLSHSPSGLDNVVRALSLPLGVHSTPTPRSGPLGRGKQAPFRGNRLPRGARAAQFGRTERVQIRTSFWRRIARGAPQ